MEKTTPAGPKEVPTQKAAQRFGPVSALLITLLAFLGSQILAGVLIALVLAALGKDSGYIVDLLSESTFGQFLFILVVEILTLGILFWFIRSRGITYTEIGLGRGPRPSDAGYGVLTFVIYFVLLAIILALVGIFAPGINLDQEQQIGFEGAKEGGGGLALVFISLVILPPIVEEILVRGFLYSGLRRKYNKLTAALFASAVFGIAHLQLGSGAPPLYVAAIDTFVLSMVLIALREKTGSIWAGMGVHALKNGLAFLALFVFSIA